MGKFDKQIKGDIKPKISRKVVSKSFKDEKSEQLDILNKIGKGKAEVSDRKAIKTLQSSGKAKSK